MYGGSRLNTGVCWNLWEIGERDKERKPICTEYIYLRSSENTNKLLVFEHIMTNTLNDHLTRHLARYFDFEAETPSLEEHSHCLPTYRPVGVVYFGKIDYLGRTGRWRADINAWKFLSYGSCCCLCVTRFSLVMWLRVVVSSFQYLPLSACRSFFLHSTQTLLGYWVFITPSASILCSLDMTVFAMLSCSRLKYLPTLRFQGYAWHIYYASCLIITLHPHHLSIRKMSFPVSTSGVRCF